MLVEQGPVDLEELRRHRPDARRGRDRERRLHVRGDPLGGSRREPPCDPLVRHAGALGTTGTAPGAGVAGGATGVDAGRRHGRAAPRRVRRLPASTVAGTTAAGVPVAAAPFEPVVLSLRGHRDSNRTRTLRGRHVRRGRSRGRTRASSRSPIVGPGGTGRTCRRPARRSDRRLLRMSPLGRSPIAPIGLASHSILMGPPCVAVTRGASFAELP